MSITVKTFEIKPKNKSGRGRPSTQTRQVKKYRAVFSWTDEEGNHRQKAGPWRLLRKEAEADYENFEQYYSSRQITFQKAVETYFESVRNKLSPGSLRMYQSGIKNHFSSLYPKDIREISPKDIKKCFSQPRFEANSTATKNRLRANLSAIFQFIVEYYELKENPVKKTSTFKKNPQEKMHEMQVMSPEQISELCKEMAIKAPETSRCIKFLYLTGLRINECLSLTFSDIHENSIHVYRQYYDGDWHPLKSQSSIRTISLNKEAMSLIEEQRQIYQGSKWFRKDWFLFGGAKIKADNSVRYQFAKYQRILGWSTKYRIHDIRHSHASFLLANVKTQDDLIKISKRLGHSNLSITLNTYVHLLNQDESQLLLALDNAFAE